jgi:hypothetical protein
MASLSVKALWSATAIRTPLTASSALSSHRLFHSSRAAFNDSKESTDATTPAAAATSEGDAEAEAEAEAAAPVEAKLPFRRRNFNKWLRTEGARFATPSFSGPNYIGETVCSINIQEHNYYITRSMVQMVIERQRSTHILTRQLLCSR